MSPRRVSRLLNLSSRVPRMQRALTRFHARSYARTGGRRGGRWVGGLPVMLIETVGRRSGRRRASPIVYVPDGDAWLVTPANAGAERTPAWWLNLRDAGAATILLRGERIDVRPRVLEGAERERAWHAMVDAGVALDDYATFTERRFPMVRLESAVAADAIQGGGPVESRMTASVGSTTSRRPPSSSRSPASRPFSTSG